MAPVAPPPRPFRSLSRTLIRSIVAAGAICALTVAALQVGLTYHTHRNNFEAEVRSIARTNVPLLSVNLWDIEPDAIRRQLKLLAERPQIAYVRLEAVTGQEFQSGNFARYDDPGAITLEIPYPAGKEGTLGTLHISPNSDHLYGALAGDVLRVLAGYALLTGLICVLVTAMLRRQLQLPMQRIAEFASSLTPDQLTRPLQLERPFRPWRDEIDEVAEGFRVLQDDIRHHVENLDSQVAQRTAELRHANAQLEGLARRDPMTGLANRRRFDHEKLRAWDQMLSGEHPLSVLMIDIDYFKNYNDTYGHAAGDDCLVAVASTLSQSFQRQGALSVRMGGEEFLVMLEGIALSDAIAYAEVFRRQVYDLALPHAKSVYRRVTVSVGVSAVTPNTLPERLSRGAASPGIAELLRRADEALYNAKAAGRNKVIGLTLQSVSTVAPAQGTGPTDRVFRANTKLRDS